MVPTGRSDIRIRDLMSAPDELLAAFEFIEPGFAAASADPAAGVREFVAEPSAFALGAFVDGMPAGFAWGLQMVSPTGRRTSYLHQLHVAEAHRRRGVGRALVLDAMERARRAGSSRFWLSTGGHNTAAQALYDSLGGDRKPLGDVNYWWQLDAPT